MIFIVFNYILVSFSSPFFNNNERLSLKKSSNPEKIVINNESINIFLRK